MQKILKYIVGTVLINGIVIGAPYWRMLGNLGLWIRGSMEAAEIFGFYDGLSWLQIVVIGICELWLLLGLLPKGESAEEAEERRTQR